MTKAPLTEAVEQHEQGTLTDSPPPKPSENTVYVVVSNYANDPHPHVEGVFQEREPAIELKKRCACVASSPHPIAWDVIETEVQNSK